MNRPKIRVTKDKLDTDAAPRESRRPGRVRIEGSASWNRSWSHGASRFVANQSERRFSIEVRDTWFSALNAIVFMIFSGGIAALFLLKDVPPDKESTMGTVIGVGAALATLAGIPSLLGPWLPERWTFDRNNGLFIHERALRGRVVRSFDELRNLEVIEHEQLRSSGRSSSRPVYGRALRLYLTERGRWLELDPLGGDLTKEQLDLVYSLGETLALFLGFDTPRCHSGDDMSVPIS